MAEDPIDKFNRLLGNRTGRPTTRYRPQVDSFAGSERRVRAAARGNTYTPKAITNALNRGSSGGRPRTSTRVDDVFTSTYDRLMDDFNKNAAEQQVIAQENEREEDHGFFGNLARRVGLVDPFNPESGFSSSIIGRGLDVVSRPAYGLAEGLQSLAEHEDQGWNPSNLWDSLTEFGAGVGRGVSGEEKTGFGQFYESWKNNQNSDIGGALRDFEAAHPTAESWLSRTAGVAGELFLDPLNKITPARTRIAAETGQVATESVLRNTLLDSVDEITRDFNVNQGLLGGIYKSNPERLTAAVNKAVNEAFDKSLLGVSRGGSRGTRVMNNRIWPVTVAETAANEISAKLTAALDERLGTLRSGRVSAATVDTVARFNPDYDTFVTRLTDQLLEKNIISDASTEAFVAALKAGRISDSMWDNAYRETVGRYAAGIDDFKNQVLDATKNQTYSTVGVRVGNKVIPFKAPGRAYRWTRSQLNGRTPWASDLFQGTVVEKMMPNVFSIKAARARAAGMNGISNYRESLQKMARAFSPEEAAELTRYLEEGITSVGNPKFDEALTFLNEQYSKMFNDEVANGARAASGLGSNVGENYSYLFNKGGSKAARETFKAERKKAFNNPSVRGAGEWDLRKAREMGLKPVDNAFENLFMRYVKSSRDNTRAFFLNDLTENYGLRRSAAKNKALGGTGLKAINSNYLNQGTRQSLEAAGETMYLPKEIAQVAEDVNEMLSWSPAKWGQMGRSFASIINKIKAMQTIPNPGFHVKNIIGDIWMGLMDDINPSAYGDVVSKWGLDKAGKSPEFHVLKNGELDIPFKEMLQLYHRNADAGFFQVEFGTYNSITAGRIPRRLGRKVANTARKLSDERELVGRFTHFVEAYKQEARALYKRGMRDIDVIRRRAEDAALWRVNRYKFDYAALSVLEKKAKTLAFPFYTYMRKAIPLLLEQMFSNPHYMSLANRFMTYNDGSSADNFNALNIPQYMKDMGFGLLTDEEEPFAVTSDLLPIGALSILASGSLPDFANNVLSNLNPLAAAPVELATGRELFTNRPLQGSTWDYMMQQIPLLGDVQSELGVDIPGLIPGLPELSGESGRESGQFLSSRFAGIGLPARRITSQQQEAQQQANRDRLIDDPLNDFNYSQDRFFIDEIYSDGAYSYAIKDKASGETLASASSPQAAIDYAKSLPGSNYEEEYVSPYRPPTLTDVLSRLNPGA